MVSPTARGDLLRAVAWVLDRGASLLPPTFLFNLLTYSVYLPPLCLSKLHNQISLISPQFFTISNHFHTKAFPFSQFFIFLLKIHLFLLFFTSNSSHPHSSTIPIVFSLLFFIFLLNFFNFLGFSSHFGF